ncbi:unnamed protein product, partial [Discosporangium mesarthrocarpum]
LKDEQLAVRSLWLFDRGNPVREICIRVMRSPSFDRIIIFFIVVNSVFLAIIDYGSVDDEYNPTSNGSVRNTAVEYAMSIFTWGFFLEALIKIVACGFRPYFRDGWNRLDFVVSILG